MRKVVKITLLVAAALSILFVNYAFAQNEGLGGIATNVTKSFEAIGKLLIAMAYVAGIGFAIASIFKFKQHKDNPTQIPIGTPIALLVIAIALVFLPMFFGPAGETLFGGSGKPTAGGFEGSGVSKIPGASGGS